MVACLRPLSSMSSQPTQRVALPQASTSPPSRLWMRMKASAPPLDRSMVIIWSKPMASAAPSALDGLGREAHGSARGASKTMNSLPRPFILRNGIAPPVMGAGPEPMKSTGFRPYMAERRAKYQTAGAVGHRTVGALSRAAPSNGGALCQRDFLCFLRCNLAAGAVFRRRPLLRQLIEIRAGRTPPGQWQRMDKISPPPIRGSFRPVAGDPLCRCVDRADGAGAGVGPAGAGAHGARPPRGRGSRRASP